MAGILDSKTRIMDVIITQEGKRQMASGKLRAEFISFTDGQAFYEADIVSGSTDASKRIYFEATSTLNDRITLESDDSGKLLEFDISPQYKMVGDKLFTKGINNMGMTTRNLNIGDSFASVGNMIATESINHFKNQYMIGTRTGINSELPNDGFALSHNNINFVIKKYSPFPRGAWKEKINIDAIEPMFTDKRLSHLPNFKFLPPLTTTGNKLGRYESINEEPPLTYDDLMKSLGTSRIRSNMGQILERSRGTRATDPFNQSVLDDFLKNYNKPPGIDAVRPYKVINFRNSSRENNVVAQVFELHNNKFSKLDVIDFGIFNDKRASTRIQKHVFFVGKVYIDSNSIPTFVNLFTIIMD